MNLESPVFSQIIYWPLCHSKDILKNVSSVFVYTVKVSEVQNNTGPNWLSLYEQKQRWNNYNKISFWSEPLNAGMFA